MFGNCSAFCIFREKFPVIGGPVFAILIGMVLALVIKNREPLEGGVKYTSKKICTICSCIAWFWIEFRSRYADRKTITTDYSVYDYNFSCNCVYAS